jgi:hypothetical protein
MKLTCHLFLFCTDSSDTDFRIITKVAKEYYRNAKFQLGLALKRATDHLGNCFLGQQNYQATAIVEAVVSSHSCFSTQARFKFMRHCHAKIGWLRDLYYALNSCRFLCLQAREDLLNEQKPK